MFGFLRSILWPRWPILYVMISPERLSIKYLPYGRVVSDVPDIAISKDARPKILAIGAKARNTAALQLQPYQVINPFGHPRSLVSDFALADSILKHQVRRVMGRFTPCPIIIMHPLGNPAGGFTCVERRTFRDLALASGASKVYIKEGKPLTDQEILEIAKNINLHGAISLR